MSDRPRIQFLVDRPRWAQARTARAISRYLSDEFDCRVRFESERPDLRDRECDLLYVSSWSSTWYRQFDFAPRQIVKAVTNHRWADPETHSMTPEEFAANWLSDAGSVACCSERLRALIEPHRSVALTPVGFDPFVFPAHEPWRGPLHYGWAGDKHDARKGIDDVIRPASEELELHIAGGDLQLGEMGRFFRSIDVFALASEHEGGPLTLVEAMASGCFPVCTDVGIVPELVEHGENGLIVERDIDAFRAAFEWCAKNADQVRRAGLRNAERMHHRRTWEHVADSWRRAFREALGRRIRPVSRIFPVVGTGSPRVALLVPDPAGSENACETAIRRLLPDHRFEVGSANREPNDIELSRMSNCDVAVVCGGDLAKLVDGGALAPSVLDRLAMPVLPLGVSCGHSDDPELPRRLQRLARQCDVIGARDMRTVRLLQWAKIANVQLTGPASLFGPFDAPEFGFYADGPTHLALSGVRGEDQLDELCARVAPILIVHDAADFAVAARLVRRHRLDVLTAGVDDIDSALAEAGRVLTLRAEYGMCAVARGKQTLFLGDDPETAELCELLDLPLMRHIDGRRLAESEPPASMLEFIERWHELRRATGDALRSSGLTPVADPVIPAAIS